MESDQRTDEMKNELEKIVEDWESRKEHAGHGTSESAAWHKCITDVREVIEDA